MATRTCSIVGCEQPGAFRTTTKPTWCDDHIDEILRRGGLEPLEAFTKPTAWRLTRCLTCGCEAHYRFVYTLDQNALGHLTCRACFWRQWAEETRAMQGPYADLRVTDPQEARRQAEAGGWEYLGALTERSVGADPHRVRCTRCGRISAKRLGDLGFGCSCGTNSQGGPAPKRAKTLLKDMDSPVLEWWDHDANDAAVLATVTPGARREVYWRCPDCAHSFTARVLDMSRAPTCPKCEAVERERWAVTYERYRATPVSEVPELMAAWADPGDPTQVMVVGWSELRVFRCAAGHHPRVSPWTFKQSGCPSCRGIETRRQRDEEARAAAERREAGRTRTREQELTALIDADRFDYYVRDAPTSTDADYDARVAELRTIQAAASTKGPATATDDDEQQFGTPAGLSPELLQQWHPKRNGKLVPESIRAKSRRQIWWLEPSCGHEWVASPADRQKGRRLRCTECDTILDSLAFHRPDLAREWAPENPRTAWQVRVSGTTQFVPLWVCRENPSHTWRTTLASRASGSGCPDCRQAGKSQVELEHLAAAAAAFGQAASGAALRDPAFKRRASWAVDITVELTGQRLLVIEYDGAYWHADKADVDTAKSLDLLAAGHLVVRLREHPLASLAVHHKHYREFVVHPTVQEPAATTALIAEWLRSLGMTSRA